ncbi:hypothetical protein SBA4_4670010 [Candidatus Sulfopaludibacter sp. SbA4]|nr:hypothetical protein SBA4_4670010 [Candidatus Sulfopaludibacter sp. SbA4]
MAISPCDVQQFSRLIRIQEADLGSAGFDGPLPLRRPEPRRSRIAVDDLPDAGWPTRPPGFS